MKLIVPSTRKAPKNITEYFDIFFNENLLLSVIWLMFNWKLNILDNPLFYLLQNFITLWNNWKILKTTCVPSIYSYCTVNRGVFTRFPTFSLKFSVIKEVY
jgi:hypothetical protein